MSMSDFSAPISALSANATGMQTSAHNIANVNTNNYNSLNTSIRSNSSDTGVQAYTQQPDRATISAEAQSLVNSPNIGSPTANSDYGSSNISNSGSLEDVTSSVASTESSSSLQSVTDGIVADNNVDYARETANTISYERSFEANTVSIRTDDEMLGTVVNMMA